ncbi:MAG: hypothetical protein WHS65_05620 [Melioribacteraceae bacterium]
MKLNEDKYYYLRNVKISVVLSLLLIIASFLILPNVKINQRKISYYQEPIIKLFEIPQTKLSLPAKTIPAKPELNILVEEPEILPDVILSLNESGDSNQQLTNRQTETIKAKDENIIFFPQQTLEILPVNQGIKGIIKFELLIDENGEVKNYKILSSTIKSEEKISEIISAVLKSKWQPLPAGKEYIVEKIYQFN